MTIFTITETNEIAIHGNQEAADTVGGAEMFTTQDELAALAANWPISRLVEIWNTIRGHTPVTKFTDKKTAVNRIWKAIQTLCETYDLADRASAPVCETIQVEETEAPVGAAGTEPAQEPTTFEEEVAEPVHEDSQPEVPAGEPEANVGAQTPDVSSAPAFTGSINDLLPAGKRRRRPREVSCPP